jgi:hypothetical protein
LRHQRLLYPYLAAIRSLPSIARLPAITAYFINFTGLPFTSKTVPS